MRHLQARQCTHFLGRSEVRMTSCRSGTAVSFLESTFTPTVVRNISRQTFSNETEEAYHTESDADLEPAAEQIQATFDLGSCVQRRQSPRVGGTPLQNFQFHGLGESISGALTTAHIQVRGTDLRMATSTARSVRHLENLLPLIAPGRSKALPGSGDACLSFTWASL